MGYSDNTLYPYELASTYNVIENDSLLSPRTVGNIYIKHNDKWRGDFYLKDDLSFVTDKRQAAKFYLLKTGDTTIVNGDRISINIGSRSLNIDNEGNIRLTERDQLTREFSNKCTFIRKYGSDTIDPISYESNIIFISDKNNHTALKYTWDNNFNPNLINSSINDQNIWLFQFMLERSDNPITRSNITKNTSPASSTIRSKTLSYSKPSEITDGYKGAIMIFLLVIILILYIVVSKY